MPYDNGAYDGYGAYEGFLDLSKPSMVPILAIVILLIVMYFLFTKKK
jgi:hypothetical protein